jgi:hypothetical protein
VSYPNRLRDVETRLIHATFTRRVNKYTWDEVAACGTPTLSMLVIEMPSCAVVSCLTCLVRS